ncbi:hypothetical protein PMAYCL1PPCAC_03381, partial [Pristionchus mayeri]
DFLLLLVLLIALLGLLVPLGLEDGLLLRGRLLPLHTVVLLLGHLPLLDLALVVLHEERAVELLEVLSLLIVGPSELVLLLSVEVTADAALLVLVVLAHLDLGGVSVEFNADAIKLDDDEVVLLVDAGVLQLLSSLDLLSIDGHSHLVLSLVHLQLDHRILRDDLHLLLLSVLRDLLDQNGELGLRGRAVLGQHGVAGGHGGTVDDVIERVDLAGLDGALGLGLLDEVGSEGREGTDGGHRLTTDVHQTEGHGQTVVTDGKLLGGSLDGQIGVLTGGGLDGELSADDSLLVVSVVDRGLVPGSHLGVGVDSVDEGTGEGAGDLVLGDELVLVQHGRLNEEGVLLEGGHLLLLLSHQLHPFLLLLVLLSLDLDLHLVLLIGSPARLDVDGEFAVLLLLQFLQGSGHLGVEHLDRRLHLPVAGLLLHQRGSHSGEVDLAVSQLVVAHRPHFHLGLSLLATSDGLDLGEETVGVGLLRLVLLRVLVEKGTTLLLIFSLLVLLSLEVLLVVLVEESLHRGSLHLLLIELLHLSLDHVLLGSLLSLLEGDLQIVLSDEHGRGDSLRSSLPDVSMDVSLNVDLHSGGLLQMGRADLVHERLEFLHVDRLLLRFNVRASVLRPDTDEGDGAGRDLGKTTGLLGEGEGGLDLELVLPLHLSGHVDGDVHLGRVEHLDSERDHGVHTLDRSDVSRGESGAGLDAQTE